MTKAQALPVQVLNSIRVATIVFALLMMWVLLPTSQARAASMSEAQIQAVLNLLSTFGTDDNTVANVSIALNGGGPGDMKNIRPLASTTKEKPGKNSDGEKKPSICAVFARTLKLGSQGDDVQNLQEYLKSAGDLQEATTTKYFGEKTKAALKRWQIRMGIAPSSASTTSDSSTGLGTVGPLTRSQLAEKCMKEKEKHQNPNATTTRPVSPPLPTPTTTSGTSDVLQPSFASTDVGKSVILMTDGVLALSEGLSKNFSQHLSDVGDGMAAVISGYLSLFEL